MSSPRLPSLRAKHKPRSVASAPAIQVIDLFAGCGGLTLGVEQAAVAAGRRVEVGLALDFDAAATAVYANNFPGAEVRTGSVEEYFDGQLGEAPTKTERELQENLAGAHLLMGGPPCQGHSNLNNRTRRKDPKNELYARMGRAAEVLAPELVLIENVPSVRLDTDQVVQTTVSHLESIGYRVHTETLALHALGVAQTRRRHVLLASKNPAVDPVLILSTLASRMPNPIHNLKWAIGDLVDVHEPTGYDIPPAPSPINRQRMQYLLSHNLYNLPNELRPACHQNAHSYKSMYGRLSWEEPAQTITSGFGSIGQGRYMHPDRPRALTGHEAARIQGFPDYFTFARATKRSEVATMIGNAVPPALTRELVTALLRNTPVHKLVNADDAKHNTKKHFTSAKRPLPLAPTR